MNQALAALVVVMLLVSCVLRDDDVGSRTNPYDAGGDSWSINAVPELSAGIDSGWVAFNYSDSTGSLRLRINASDRNIPYDSLEYTVTLTSGGTSISSSTTRDSVLLIGSLKTNTSYRCSVTVIDSKSGTAGYAFTVTTKAGIPPPPPQPYIVSGTSTISLYWQMVSGADEYRVYSSSTPRGPFSLFERVNQPVSGTITVTDTPAGYSPVYYRVASANSSGESFAPDTLLGRRYYSSLTTPYISSVSQGSYTGYIRLSIEPVYQSDIKTIEIYRSVADTTSFRLIGTVANAYPSSSYSYFNDTTSTGLTCFYKVAAIDNLNRSSRMSSAKSGYLQRISAPSGFTTSPSAEYIAVSWSSVYNAKYYKIYRSTISCTSGMSVIDSVTTTRYIDTVATSEYYYYSVSGVDQNEREGTASSCSQAKITILPAPVNLTVSAGTYLHYISLSWSAVSGSSGYIIYRNNSGSTSDYTPIDTITSTMYSDSVSDATIQYYRVAAFNQRGTGTTSTMVTGYTVQPPVLYATSTDFVRLYWSSVAGAKMFYIYRSKDSTGFLCIDSTTGLYYNDTLSDYATYLYRLTMRVTDGVTAPGNTLQVARAITAPTGLAAIDHEQGTRLTWNASAGADLYRLYRSLSSSSYSVYKEVTDTFYFDSITSADHYYYRVDAHIGIRYSPISGYVIGGTITAPGTPTGFSVTGTPADIVLSWNMPSTSSTPAGYIIFRSTSSAGPFSVIDTATATLFHDSVPDTLRYYYYLTAYNNKGSSEKTSTYSAKRVAPSYPASVRVSQATYASKIVITWNPVASATGYRCYRSTTSSGAFTLIATTSDTLVNDSTCTPNTTYYYKVASFTDALAGTMSPSYSGVRLGAPSAISINSYVYGIRLSWAAPSYSVARYFIYRSNSPSGTFSKIDSTSLATYTDSFALEGNNYYRVSAKNYDETPPGPVSSAAHVLFPMPPTSISATKGTETNRIIVTWTSSVGATGYRLFRSSASGSASDLVLRATVTAAMFIDSVTTDSVYSYKVKSFNTGGESALCDSIAAGYRQPTTAPAAPVNVTVEPVNGYLEITWDAPPSSVGYTGYRLYRSTSQTGSDSTIFTTSNPSYSDLPPLSFPTVYWYRVTAYNQKGESTFSVPVSGSRN